MTGTLAAVTRDGLTANEAITWWRTVPGGGPPVGFGYSARAATWWRVVDGEPVTGEGAADLSEVYELVGFDGDRELRWRKNGDGRGSAVVLAETGDLLPEGGDDATRGGATPLETRQTRILAGKVERLDTPGWVRLTAARYAPAVIPLAVSPDADLTATDKDTPAVVLESVEYVEEDEHGNTSVVDRRLVRLRLVPHRKLRLRLNHKEG